MTRRRQRVPGAVALAVLANAIWLAPALAAEPPAAPNPWWAGYAASPLIRAPGGRRFKVYCTGSRGPTVILESGLGDGASSWRHVQLDMARSARVCSYDRSGLGESDPSRGPRDVDDLAADLDLIVQAVGRRRPVVLVGHSLGGAIVRQYAYGHRDRVAGMVLVDSSSDHQAERFRRIKPSLARVPEPDPARQCVARLGQRPVPEDLPEGPRCIGGPPPDASANLIPRLRSDRERPDRWIELIAERGAAFDGTNDREADRARHGLGDLPMIVLTAADTGKDPSFSEAEEMQFFQAVYEMHNAISGLSTRGRRRVIAGSNHYIQNDRPQAVIEAVADVVADARRR